MTLDLHGLPGVALRPARPADEPFLCALYASTRQAELAATDWLPEQIDAFLADQFALQSRHYAEHYADAAFSVVEQDGEPVGRLIVLAGADEVRLVDVSLVAERRGRGLGTALVQRVLAAASGRRVVLHVEVFNPALRLYERLGFRAAEQVGAYWRMEAEPGAPDGAGA